MRKKVLVPKEETKKAKQEKAMKLKLEKARREKEERELLEVLEKEIIKEEEIESSRRGSTSSRPGSVSSRKNAARHRNAILNFKVSQFKKETISNETPTVKLVEHDSDCETEKKPIPPISRLRFKRLKTVRKKFAVKSEDDPDDSDEEEYYEEELFTRSEGYCFGEWGLIYKCARATSVYALENTYFFALDYDGFKNSFLKCLNKAESERREFMVNNFFPSKFLRYDILSELYKNTVPIQCPDNQKIFIQDEKASKIYLVYLGTFTLEKTYFEPFQNKTLKFNVLNIDKGAVCGLESLYEKDGKYKYSLRSNVAGGFGMIFSLSVEKIPESLKGRFKNYFKDYYKTFEDTIQNVISKKIELNKKISQSKKRDNDDENERCQKVIDKFLMENEKKLKKNQSAKEIRAVSKLKVIKPFTKATAEIALKTEKKLKNRSASAINLNNPLNTYEKKTLPSRNSRKRICLTKKKSSVSTRKSVKTQTVVRSFRPQKSRSDIGLPNMQQTTFTKITKTTQSQKGLKKISSCSDLTREFKKTFFTTGFNGGLGEKTMSFDSGTFDIPLVSKIM